MAASDPRPPGRRKVTLLSEYTTIVRALKEHKARHTFSEDSEAIIDSIIGKYEDRVTRSTTHDRSK